MIDPIQRQTLFASLDPAAGWTATLWPSKRDAADHLDLCLAHPDQPWCHTACRIIQTGAQTTLHTAFSLDVIDYALPEDLPAQEAVNDMLAQCLTHDFPGIGPTLIDTLQANWTHSKDRLQNRWAENAANNQGMEKLSILREHGRDVPAFAAPSTRLGAAQYVGVAELGGRFRRVSSVQLKSFKARYATHATLKKMDQFSPTEQMQILQGTGPTTEAARTAFLDQRRGFWGRRDWAQPIASPDAAASARQDSYHQFSTEITFADGGSGSASATSDSSHAQFLRIARYFDKTDLWIQWDEKGLAIERSSCNETRFVSPDVLDANLRPTLEMILALDPVWPNWVTRQCQDAFDPQHPLLAGLDVPPRHQLFFGAVLGAAYDTAHKGAEKLATLRARKAQKVESLSFGPDDYPDGTIFGKLKAKVPSDKARFAPGDFKHLSIATTTSEPGKRRRRALASLDVFHGDKPMTPKHLQKLVPLPRADAFEAITDYYLGHDARDAYMMAAKVAETLQPGAENPLLHCEPVLNGLPLDGEDSFVRVTHIPAKDGHALLAYRIIRKAEHLPDASFGIAFLTTPDVEWTHLLPSTLPKGARWRDADQAELEKAIQQTTGPQAKQLLLRLRAAFSNSQAA